MLSSCFHGPHTPSKFTHSTAQSSPHHSYSRFSASNIIGGGYRLAQERKTETLQEFNARMENPGALLIQTTMKIGDPAGLA